MSKYIYTILRHYRIFCCCSRTNNVFWGSSSE